MYRVSGAFAPSTGVGAELSIQYQKYRTLLFGLNLKATRHTLSADSAASITRTLSGLSYQLPAGDRPYLLLSVGLEPRVVAYETDRVGLEAGVLLQGWQRQFSLVRKSPHEPDEKESSQGWGIGGRLALDFTMSDKLSLNAGITADRMKFGTFQWLERSSTSTSATWWGLGLSVGATYSISH
jgi:hypothetical protein